MMIIQDENRLKEEEEEEEQEQEEQESSRMSTETNSTVKADEEDIHDLSLSNGKKAISPDLGKSGNRRKQVKPNR